MMVVFNNGAPIVSRRFGFGESEPQAAPDQTPFVLLNADSSSVFPITSSIATAMQLYGNYTSAQTEPTQASLPANTPGSQFTTRTIPQSKDIDSITTSAMKRTILKSKDIDSMVTTYIVVRPQSSSNSNVKIGQTSFIWAMSSQLPPSLNQDVVLSGHDIGRGTFSLNLTNPTALLLTEPPPFNTTAQSHRDLQQHLLTAHGVMMVFAWSVFSMFGVFSAALLRHLRDRWFKLHAGLQLTAIIMTVAGFGFAVAMTIVSNQGQFVGSHAIFGLVFTLLAISQGVIGWVAHSKYDPKQDQRHLRNNIHIILGHFLFACAPAQIWSRLTIYGNMRQKVVFVVWTFILVATLVGIRAWRYFMKPKAVPAFDSHRHASDIDGEYDFSRGNVEHIPEDDRPAFQDPFGKEKMSPSDPRSKGVSRQESEPLSPPLPSPPGRSISQRLKKVFTGRTSEVKATTATGGVPVIGLRRSDTMARVEAAFSWKANEVQGPAHSAEWDVS